MSTRNPALSRGADSIQVLMATTSYPRGPDDWKGRFIFELAAALGRSRQVRLSLWGPPGELPAGVDPVVSVAEMARLVAMADQGGIAHLLRTRPIRGLLTARGLLTDLSAACQRKPVQLYHVNWLQLAIGLPDDQRPAYVSALGSDFGLLRLPGMTRLLRQAFSRRPILIAPNAAWMAETLIHHFGDVARVEPNPFGVAPEWFDLVREPSLPQPWLVVSRITRKKLGDLPTWGAGLFGGARRLVLLGPAQEQISLPGWIEQAGATDPVRLRHRWFPGAAGLLTLSRHDEGRPQVLIEAMAAGLPVIASRLPAHADLIRHGETGWLVDSRDELAEALRQAEDPAIAARIGAAARVWVRERIGTWDDCARRCIEAYQGLLQRSAVHGD